MAVDRILTIPRSFDFLAFPLKSSVGLKYSSVALSSSIICLGTNTGSTYVFEKESLQLVRFIASKGGSIEILQFSKDEKLLAIADSSGIVTCLEVIEEKYELKVIKEIEDHKGTRITALTWDDDSARLFIGDERGIVTAVIVAPFKLPTGKFLSKSTIEIVVKGESPIVQLDYSESKLLVSTTARTLLCLTDKSKYQQVGSKPRDGKFGSCFLQYGEGGNPVIYAARPGSRLWEVDFNGQVLATHQFKYLLSTAPTKLCGYIQGRSFVSDQTWDKPQSVVFPKLLPLCNRYLVTWSSFALYILDASLGKIIGWFDEIKGIKDVSCKNEVLFVVNHDGEVLGFEFMALKNCLKCIIAASEYQQAAEIAVKYRDEILRSVESYLTIDFEAVEEKLSESGDQSVKELVESLHDLIERLQLRHNQIRAEVQERLNGLPNLDESSTPCDSGVEDNDEVRSNQSEVISETSSRLSLSRLSHVDVDRVLRRATNAVFNKIASSGFMKRALNNVRNETRQRSVSPQFRDSPQMPIGANLSDSNRLEELELCQVPNVSATNALSNLPPVVGVDNQDKEMGNVEQKPLDSSAEGDSLSGKIVHGKRPVIGKRRRKAKVVTVDFDSPEKDDIFKINAYDSSGRPHVRRLLSADSASSYTQVSDLTRKGSLPHNHLNEAESSQDSQVSPAKDGTDGFSNMSHPANIIEKAKQLVRKVIHTEIPAPLDVRKAGDVTTQDFVAIPGRLTCLLVSEDAMKSIPKFFDVTAVCRNKLRDSRTLFNSKTVKKILQDWAEKLAETVKEFSVAMANDIEKKNSKHAFTNEEAELLLMRAREEFFANLGAAFSEISNLAVLCFEAGIFPASCSDLTPLEKRLIENRVSFGKIRQEVDDILNKDDRKKAKDEVTECVVPQEATPNALLFNDELELHEGGVQDKDEVTTNESVDGKSNLSDVKTKQDRNTEEEPSLDGIYKETGESFEETAFDDIHENLCKKIESKAGLGTIENVESRAKHAYESVRTLNGIVNGSLSNVTEFSTDGDQVENEALQLDQSQNTPNSNVLRCLHTTAGTRNITKAEADLTSSSEDHTSSDSCINCIPSSTLRDYVDVQIPKKTCFLQDNIEVILCTSDDPETCQSCREDACRACFVLRYFPLLDLSKVRTVLGWKQGCRWRTWLAYLIHLEDTTSSEELHQAIASNNYEKISRLLYNSSNAEQLFSCVRRLVPSSSSLVFDLCTEKDVHPWEACFIYMIDISEFEFLSNFLNYVATIRRLKPSINPLEDISVAMTVLYCSLKFTSNIGNIDNYYCQCGAAREGAHLLPWTQKTFIDDVISVIVSKGRHRGLVDRAFDLCRRYGYWHGCIKLFRIRKEHKRAFELISQLGDFNLVNEYFQTEAFTITESDLKHLCSLIYHVRKDGTRCEPAVPGYLPTTTNESLARLLVRELGPIQALGILKCAKKDTSDLPQEFYYDCMRIAEKEYQQQQIVRKMVEALSDEACIESKSMFQRQIEQLKNRELSDGIYPQESTSKEDSVSDDMRNSTSSNHWGLNLSLASSICPCCTLSLCLHGASSSAGIIVFDCGHAYHKHCLPEEACLVCYYGLDSCEI